MHGFWIKFSSKIQSKLIKISRSFVEGNIISVPLQTLHLVIVFVMNVGVHRVTTIDLLAILQNSLDRAIFSYTLIHEFRLSDVRASISIVHIREFYKMY